MGKKFDFIVDTGATYSVLNTRQGKMTKDKCKIMGVEGKPQEHNFIEPLECDLEGKMLSYSFLCVSECPMPLIGRDLLYKLGATIYLRDKNLTIEIPRTPCHSVALALLPSTKNNGSINLGEIKTSIWAHDTTLWTEPGEHQ